MVPVLDAVPGLGAATYVRVPVSVPVEAPLNVIQLASDEAVHVQLPEAFVTVTAKEPPPAGAACVAAARLYPHAVGVVVPPLLLLQPAAAKTKRRLNARQSFMIPLHSSPSIGLILASECSTHRTPRFVRGCGAASSPVPVETGTCLAPRNQ